jgi:CdiI immunity protein
VPLTIRCVVIAIGAVVLLIVAVVLVVVWRIEAERRSQEAWRRYQELVAAHPNIPLEPALARRLARDPEYEELRHFLGAYFHQDWKVGHDSREEVVDDYIRHSSQDAVTTLAREFDQLLKLGLSEGEMQEALDILDSDYIPLGDATAWVRSVRAGLDENESGRN